MKQSIIISASLLALAGACSDPPSSQHTSDGVHISLRGLPGEDSQEFRGTTPAVLTAYEGVSERSRLEFTATHGADLLTISLSVRDPQEAVREYELGRDGDVWLKLNDRELRVTSGTLELREERGKLVGALRAELPEQGGELSGVLQSELAVRCLVNAEAVADAPSGAVPDDGRPVWKQDRTLTSTFCQALAR